MRAWLDPFPPPRSVVIRTQLYEICLPLPTDDFPPMQLSILELN